MTNMATKLISTRSKRSWSNVTRKIYKADLKSNTKIIFFEAAFIANVSNTRLFGIQKWQSSTKIMNVFKNYDQIVYSTLIVTNSVFIWNYRQCNKSGDNEKQENSYTNANRRFIMNALKFRKFTTKNKMEFANMVETML